MVGGDINSLVSSKAYNQIRDTADALCSQNDAGSVLSAAIQCKIAGQIEAAFSLLASLVRKYPAEPACQYELGIMWRDRKNLAMAVRHAEAAAALAPDSFRLGLFYAHMLFANGAWKEGHQRIDALVPGDADEELERLATKDFGNYLKDVPRSMALYLTEKIRDKYYWMNAAEVAGAIERAVQEKRPFSLIRLGDGDGAHFRVNAEDETRYPHLYKATRKQHTTFLLGEDVDPVFTGYTGLTSKLVEYVCEADILGIAYPSWIEHEYDISSRATINCLLNINRHFYENERLAGLSVCDQLIHIQLHTGKFIEPIVSTLSSLTVISCLDDLPSRIRDRFGIKDVELIKIPSETYAPHLYGEVKLRRSLHYPHAFWPTVERLSVPHNGRVFLIAAGTFGKYYASIIKRHGGIALDLGSLVDAWMGMVSRPGYAAIK